MRYDSPKLKRASDKPELGPREFWCEEIFEWADGEVGATVHAIGYYDAERAAKDFGSHIESQDSEYCNEHVVRVTDSVGQVTLWDVTGEQSIDYSARERATGGT